MPIATTFASSVGFTYSCSSVYNKSFGISDTTCSSEVVLAASAGVYGRQTRMSSVSADERRTIDVGTLLAGRSHRGAVGVDQRRPCVLHLALELRERAVV